MHLFKLEVRPNWQEYDRTLTTGYARLWRWVQFTVLLSTALMVVVQRANLSAPWDSILRIGLSSALFLSFSLWTAYRTQGRAARKALLAYALFFALAALTGFALLPRSSGEIQPGSFWTLLPVAIPPVLVWIFMAENLRRYPQAMRLIGFNTGSMLVNLLLGIAAGGSLGLHFLLTTGKWFGASGAVLQPATVAWTFLFLVGLGALGEETILRGLSFHLLYEESENSFWKAAAQIAFLNVLIYIIPASQASSLLLGVWLLVYRLIYSLGATYLRYSQGNIIVCIAFNVIFNTSLAGLLLW